MNWFCKPLGDILAHFLPFYGRIARYTPINVAKNDLKISSQILTNQFLELP